MDDFDSVHSNFVFISVNHANFIKICINLRYNLETTFCLFNA